MIDNNDSNYGLLLNSDITLHRKYFDELVKLLGIKVVYRAPQANKTYTTYTEIESNYQSAEVIGCIFEEHPQQKTMKKLGWLSELETDASIIHVPYDLHDLQQGALFIIPSGIDNAKGRLFRVVELSNSIIYPSAMTCKLAPEYLDTYSNTQSDYTHSNYNLLREEE